MMPHPSGDASTLTLARTRAETMRCPCTWQPRRWGRSHYKITRNTVAVEAAIVNLNVGQVANEAAATGIATTPAINESRAEVRLKTHLWPPKVATFDPDNVIIRRTAVNEELPCHE